MPRIPDNLLLPLLLLPALDRLWKAWRGGSKEEHYEKHETLPRLRLRGRHPGAR